MCVYPPSFSNGFFGREFGIENVSIERKFFSCSRSSPPCWPAHCHRPRIGKPKQKVVFAMMNSVARRALSVASRQVNGAGRHFSALVAPTEEFPG